MQIIFKQLFCIAAITLCATTPVQSADLNLVTTSTGFAAGVNALITLDNSTSMLQEVNVSFDFALDNYVDHANSIRRGHDFHLGTFATGQSVYTCGDQGNFTFIYGSSSYLAGQAGQPLECSFLPIRYYPAFAFMEWRVISNDGNKLYYNPQRVYDTWPGYPNADFNAVRESPLAFESDYNVLRNLGTDTTFGQPGFFYAVWQDSAGFAGQYPKPNGYTSTANDIVDIWDNHTLYHVTTSGVTVKKITFSPNASKLAPGNIGSCNFGANNPMLAYANCFGRQEQNQAWSSPQGRTLAQEQQNIANWYQYHRSRAFESRYAVARIVLDLPDVRFGFTTLGDGNKPKPFIPVRTTEDVATFRDSLLKTMYEHRNGELTVLADSLIFAGEYFEGKQASHPSPIDMACEQNFHILVTDGARNTDWATTRAGMVDHDGDGYRFVDNAQSVSLADVASYFYNRDLAPNVPNQTIQATAMCQGAANVSHQGLRFINLAYGVFPKGEEPDPATNYCWPTGNLGSASDWGNPFPSAGSNWGQEPYRDLWHASYNSNGYFSYFEEAGTLIEKLESYFGDIKIESKQYAKTALSHNQVVPGTKVFRTYYDLGANQGTLTAVSVMDGTTASFKDIWSIGEGVVNSRSGSLVSFDPVKKSGITLSNDTAGAQALTNQQFERLFPLPADQANKTTVVADFITGLYTDPFGPPLNSNLMFVGNPNTKKQFTADPTGLSIFGGEFQDFVSKTNRQAMVYVASNDGRLRGFTADAGKELVTYLPNAVLSPKFAQRKTLGFQPLLDGEFVVEDVYFKNQKKWRTVLIGSMRLGGQGFYALDVTDPAQFSASSVLWEFTDEQDKDLGFSYAKPAVGLFENGASLAVFSNGYNNTWQNDDAHVSTTGAAALYLVDIESGKLVRKLTGAAGLANDPLGQDRPNGFAEPVIVDADGNGMIDRIYVGDFFGHLYAYDLTDKNPQQWGSFFGSNTSPLPLVAGAAVNYNPITIRPVVTRGQLNDELLIVYGTGESVTDSVYTTPNTMLAVYHGANPVTTLNDLKQRKLEYNGGWYITDQAKPTASTDPKGWYFTLESKTRDMGIVISPLLRLGELIWVIRDGSTAAAASCTQSSGESHIIAMNPYTGLSLSKSIFAAEKMTSTRILDGINVGDDLKSFDILKTKDGEVIVGGGLQEAQVVIEKTPVPNAVGRQSWRPL